MIDYKSVRIYNNLLWLCIKNDISIKKMLETVKLNKNTMSNIKRSKNPSIQSLVAFCNYFNIPLNDLVVKNLCPKIPKNEYENKFLSRKDFLNEETTKTTS
jgi:transcriptional regulator with XRE-family HTH domain